MYTEIAQRLEDHGVLPPNTAMMVLRSYIRWHRHHTKFLVGYRPPPPVRRELPVLFTRSLTTPPSEEEFWIHTTDNGQMLDMRSAHGKMLSRPFVFLLIKYLVQIASSSGVPIALAPSHSQALTAPELAVAMSSNPETVAIEAYLRQLLVEMFEDMLPKGAPLSRDSDLSYLGLSSFHLNRLHARLENVYKVSIGPMDTLLQLPTVGRFTDAVAKATANRKLVRALC